MKSRIQKWFEALKRNLLILIIAVLYFGFLAFTLYRNITENGVSEAIIQVAIVVFAFGIGSYIMLFSSKRKQQKRHVLQNTGINEFEITKKRLMKDKLISALFLVLGVVLMVLTLI